jgi:hypothetical protein
MMSQGLKPRVGLVVDVRAKARTYLRCKCKCNGKGKGRCNGNDKSKYNDKSKCNDKGESNDKCECNDKGECNDKSKYNSKCNDKYRGPSLRSRITRLSAVREKYGSDVDDEIFVVLKSAGAATSVTLKTTFGWVG